jgi:hypothetical protein
VAFPEYGLVAIAVRPNAAGIGELYIAHELSHLFVGQATFSCYTRAPTWLDEGLATRAEGEARPQFQSSLRNAVGRDDLFSVRALRAAFPTSAEDTTLAYAQSESFVDFLLVQHGPERMAALLGGFREGLTDDAALLRAYGFDQAGLYARWRAWQDLAAPAATVPPPAPTPVRTPAPPGLDYIVGTPMAMSSLPAYASPAARGGS